MVTKDTDFGVSHMLTGSPARLLVIATGNCRNQELLNLMDRYLPEVERALAVSLQVILTRDRLVVDD